MLTYGKTGTRELSGTLEKPQQNSRKTGKLGTRSLAGPQQEPIEKLENQDPSETLAGRQKNRKTGTSTGPSKNLKNKTKQIPQQGRKTGKCGPNVILENLYNYKSTFICVLAKKPTIFREQNFEHFNLIRVTSILKGHLCDGRDDSLVL